MDNGGNLTKADLAELLYDQLGLNKRESRDLIDAFFDHMRGLLADGADIKLSGFGGFHIIEKPARPGRNPKTGEIIPISARRVVTFRASQKLKNLVVDSGDHS